MSGDELALLKACAAGRTAEVKRLLRASVDVNAVRSADGSTALVEAAKRGRRGQQEIIKLLLKHGARPDAQTKAGQTALTLACERRCTTVARILLDNHADANYTPITGRTALMCACDRNKVDLASLLLDRGANADLAAKDGTTALMAAAKDGKLAIARLLIDRGASLDVRAEDGSTALLLACAAQKTSVAELLIEKGAKLNLRDRTGCTPLMCAPLPTVELLLDRGADMNLQDDAGSTALIRACNLGKTTTATRLAERGANLDICDRDGRTVLITACRMRSVKKELVKLLLDRGAKIVVGNESAFFEACSAGNIELADLFLEHGAEINAQDEDGNTGLMLAFRRPYLNSHEIVKFLLDRGADANIRSREGLTALMLACKEGTGASLNLLLEHNGARINEQSDDGSTALMYIFRPNLSGRDTRTTEALLACGADANIQRQDGSTALMLASLNSVNENFVDRLLKAGAKPNLQRRDGITALMIQCVNHDFGLRSRVPQVKLLMRHGAELSLRDSWGWSALEFVLADRLQFDAHGRLHMRHANRNILGSKLITEARMKLAFLLVDAGAPLDFSHVPSVKVQEALTIACRNGYFEALQVLLLRNPYRTFPSEEPPLESVFDAHPALAGSAKRRRRA